MVFGAFELGAVELRGIDRIGDHCDLVRGPAEAFMADLVLPAADADDLIHRTNPHLPGVGTRRLEPV
jgi:hypothetical protein